MHDLHDYLTSLISSVHNNVHLSPFLETLILLGLIIFTVVIIELVGRLIFLRVLESLIRRLPLFSSSTHKLDTTIIRRCIRLFTTILFKGLLPLAFETTPNIWFNGINIVCNIYIIILIIQVCANLMDAIRSYLLNSPTYRNNPFINILQIIKVVIVFLGFIYIISVIFSIDVTKIFAFLATASAVMLLIFKDTILGFVAGIQLSANDMVRVGDWITLSKYNVDGDVIDITLNTVKVRNFDKTISTVPPYTLSSESFRNWRGMSDSGGRRVMRAVYLDVNTIQFVDQSFIDKISKIPGVRDFIYRTYPDGDLKKEVESHRMTNLTLFRKYLNDYISHSDFIHKSYICMVLQKEPTDKGLPLFVYFFANTTIWQEYEEIQSNLFEYILAIVPYFNLSLVQQVNRRDINHAEHNAGAIVSQES